MSISPPQSNLTLPIDASLAEIISKLKSHSSVVLQATPGAGKTTRVPPAVLRSGLLGSKQLYILEPRRLAAKMAAERVADELGERVGKTIGYQFRLESVMSPATRICFLTEGMLMRKLLEDPELKLASMIILDEFHERHLHGDVALAQIKRLQMSRRPDLKCLVMSATLDSEQISRYLNDCPNIQVPGRQYEVSIEYLKTPPQLALPLEVQVREGVKSSLSQSGSAPGDMLVFLPGMAEIRRAEQALAPVAEREDLLVVPLHGELSKEEQNRALFRSKQRKIILSTNVAETSLTIDGVTQVIDSGLARKASFSWWSGLSALKTQAISKASAIQRAGRAGRTAPGKCLRLYSKGDFDVRAPFETPEILVSELSQTVLELKALGIQNVLDFPWFQPPKEQAVESSLILLRKLGALDKLFELTKLGNRMVDMPTHPRLAKLVLEASRFGFLREGAQAAALLGERRWTGLSDALRSTSEPLLVKVSERLRSAAQRSPHSSLPVPVGSASKLENVRFKGDVENALCFSLLSAFPDRVAKKKLEVSQGQRKEVELVLSAGGTAGMDNSVEVSASEYFVALDAEERKAFGSNRSSIQIKSLVPIEAEWLFDLDSEDLVEEEQLTWNSQRNCVEAHASLKYGQLVLSESKSPPQDKKAATQFLLDQVSDLKMICNEDACEPLQKRVSFLREHQPELDFPGFDLASVKQFLVEAASGCVRLEELKEMDPLSLWLANLTSEQRQRLDRLAPETVTLAKGRRAKVQYDPGKPPWVESRLQDFFGMEKGPSVLGGRMLLTLHLLAPNYRAVQVTTDLSGFWIKHYPALRKELGRRYPRHAWPENPLVPG